MKLQAEISPQRVAVSPIRDDDGFRSPYNPPFPYLNDREPTPSMGGGGNPEMPKQQEAASRVEPSVESSREASVAPSPSIPDEAEQPGSSGVDEEDLEDYKEGGYHPCNLGETFKDGRYLIVRKLGWGYFSTVWSAKDTHHPDTYVALKIVRAAQNYTETAIDEVKSSKRSNSADPEHLGREFVVTLSDQFMHEGPNGVHVCMVFEVLGENSSSLMKRYHYKGIPPVLVKQITMQVLSALDYTHRKCGIIHTDIKPENVLIKIRDVARVLGEMEMQMLEEASFDPQSGEPQDATSDEVKRDTFLEQQKERSEREELAGSAPISPAAVAAAASSSTSSVATTFSASNIAAATATAIPQHQTPTPQSVMNMNSPPGSASNVLASPQAHFQSQSQPSLPTSEGTSLSGQSSASGTHPLSETVYAKSTSSGRKLDSPGTRSSTSSDRRHPLIKGSQPLPSPSRRPMSTTGSVSSEKSVGSNKSISSTEIDMSSATDPSRKAENSNVPNTPSTINTASTVSSQQSTDSSSVSAHSFMDSSKASSAVEMSGGMQNDSDETARSPPNPSNASFGQNSTQSPGREAEARGFTALEEEYVTVKIADFGSACSVDHHFTDDIQTRQYRAPEVSLGAEWGAAVDCWSVACMIFESLTGDYSFEPQSSATYSKDEDHIAQIIESLGPLPAHSQKGKYSHHFFDSRGRSRNIHNSKVWPLYEVFVGKYDYDSKTARQLCDSSSPLSTLDPEKRVDCGSLVHCEWSKDTAGFDDINSNRHPRIPASKMIPGWFREAPKLNTTEDNSSS